MKRNLVRWNILEVNFASRPSTSSFLPVLRSSTAAEDGEDGCEPILAQAGRAGHHSHIPSGINKAVVTKIIYEQVVEFSKQLMRREHETTGWN